MSNMLPHHANIIAAEPKHTARIARDANYNCIRAFTLIELSITLVIIGLIVGGVLVGRDMISAAEMRAQVSQIERYNSAVNTFKGKFDALPGDMIPSKLAQFGFGTTTCDGVTPSWRNGDGFLDGYTATFTLAQGIGETALFWQDLSNPVAGSLIDAQIPNGSITSFYCSNISPAITSTGISQAFPAAKIGAGYYLYAYEYVGANWFGLANITSLDNGGHLNMKATLSVSKAYNIDKKMDDGLPTTGNVQAVYINGSSAPPPSAAPNAAADSAVTCYNTNGPGYSIGYNNGAGPNCALSFKFQ